MIQSHFLIKYCTSRQSHVSFVYRNIRWQLTLNGLCYSLRGVYIMFLEVHVCGGGGFETGEFTRSRGAQREGT